MRWEAERKDAFQGVWHERNGIFHDVPNLSDPGRAQNGEISPQHSDSIGTAHADARSLSPTMGPGSEADEPEESGKIRRDIAVKPDTLNR